MRCGDSAHGGHGRVLGAKNPKIGVREVPEGGLGAPYIERAGRFSGLEARPLAALLGVRFV